MRLLVVVVCYWQTALSHIGYITPRYCLWVTTEHLVSHGEVRTLLLWGDEPLDFDAEAVTGASRGEIYGRLCFPNWQITFLKWFFRRTGRLHEMLFWVSSIFAVRFWKAGIERMEWFYVLHSFQHSPHLTSFFWRYVKGIWITILQRIILCLRQNLVKLTGLPPENSSESAEKPQKYTFVYSTSKKKIFWNSCKLLKTCRSHN